MTTIPYPKAGTTNSAVRIGVVKADGGTTTWMQTPGDPRETYLARMEWIDDRRLAIQQLNRLQNQNDFLVRRRAHGRDEPRLPRRVEDVGGRRRRRAAGSTAAARSCG